MFDRASSLPPVETRDRNANLCLRRIACRTAVQCDCRRARLRPVRPLLNAARLCWLLGEPMGSARRYGLRAIRSWIAEKLGVKAEAAGVGDWWEIDLILVILLGAVCLGAAAWLQL